MNKLLFIAFTIILTIQQEQQQLKPSPISILQQKAQEFINRIQQYYHHIQFEQLDYELVAGYALTNVNLIDIHNLEVNVDNGKTVGLSIAGEKFRVEFTITGGYIVPLVIEGLYVSVEIKSSERDSNIDDFEIKYENAFIDSNIIVSTISSYVFSNTMLSKYIYEARQQMRFFIFKSLQYNGDLISDKLDKIEQEEPIEWVSKLGRVDGLKIKDEKIIVNLEDMFHTKRKQREQQEQKQEL